MTLDEFELLLARHGGVVDDWPSGVRTAARSLLLASAPARSLLAEAQSLDLLLRGLPPVAAPAHLKDDILARVNASIEQQAAGPASARDPFWRRFWPQMIGFAAASVLGIVIGIRSVSPLPDDMADASAYVLGYDGAPLTLTMNED